MCSSGRRLHPGRHVCPEEQFIDMIPQLELSRERLRLRSSRGTLHPPVANIAQGSSVADFMQDTQVMTL